MNLIDAPILVFILSFLALLLAAEIGNALRARISALKEDDRNDLDVVLSATLTLLGLLIGFTFSMAVTRYDQRKNYEEAEANAIGTEYARADLLAPSDSAKVRQLLKKYLDQRVLFYTIRDPGQLARINLETAELQNQMWSGVRPKSESQHDAVVALVLWGMNDVLNSQGYTQAAWWNRIPVGAWGLMAFIAVCCNVLNGYRAHHHDWRVVLVIPLAVAIAFFLICDIDDPRGGVIRVVPQNLISLSQSLSGQ